MSTKLERTLLQDYEDAEYWTERKEFCHYLGGFFDGEGCVRVSESSNGRYFNLGVSLSQKKYDESDVLFKRIQRSFGGAVSLRKKAGVLQWSISGRGAAMFLRDIHPFLILKAHQTDLALEWFNNREALTEDQSRAVYQELVMLKRVPRHVIDDGTVPVQYWSKPFWRLTAAAGVS